MSTTGPSCILSTRCLIGKKEVPYTVSQDANTSEGSEPLPRESSLIPSLSGDVIKGDD